MKKTIYEVTSDNYYKVEFMNSKIKSIVGDFSNFDEALYKLVTTTQLGLEDIYMELSTGVMFNDLLKRWGL